MFAAGGGFDCDHGAVGVRGVADGPIVRDGRLSVQRQVDGSGLRLHPPADLHPITLDDPVFREQAREGGGRTGVVGQEDKPGCLPVQPVNGVGLARPQLQLGQTQKRAVVAESRALRHQPGRLEPDAVTPGIVAALG